MLLVSEEEETLEASEVLEDTVEGVELSLNSVVGLSEPRTLKLKGVVHGLDVVVLIDCGATHNFISTSLVEAIQIPIQETSQYRVVIGSGKRLKGQGV